MAVSSAGVAAAVAVVEAVAAVVAVHAHTSSHSVAQPQRGNDSMVIAIHMKIIVSS